MLRAVETSKIAQCENCDKTEVKCWHMHGNMWLCEACRALELDAMSRAAQRVITESRQLDEKIQIKGDIFTANTTKIVEIRTAIFDNAEIAEDQKQHAFVKEISARIKALQETILVDRAALLEKENQLRMLQVNGQMEAGKLREDVRAELSHIFDITYSPATITKREKTTKSTPSGKSKSFSSREEKELYEAAKKYSVPAAQVRNIVVSRKISYEQAAKELAELMY